MASKALRWTVYGMGGILALLAVAAAILWFLSERALGDGGDPASHALSAPTPAQLADAPRQMRVLGCVGCHGEGLAGKLFFNEEGIGKVWAPNLPLIAASADDAALDRGLRRGIGHDGRALLIMPSSSYQFLTDQEAAAILAAIRALPVTGKQTPERSVGPIGRVGIVTGEFATQPKLVAATAAQPIPDLGKSVSSGRHIVETNCAECHGQNLKGKEIEPGVVSTDLAIAGSYDIDQFRNLLRKGVSPSGKDMGLMGRVAKRDFSHLTDQEIAAVHAYLVAAAQR